MGSSIAYHLSRLGIDNSATNKAATAKKNLSIAVIEKDKKYLAASAVLSAGGIRQQFSEADNTLMSMYGAEFLKSPELLQVNDTVPDFQFHEHGYLFLASKETAPILKRNNLTQRSCGVTWMDLMDVERLNKEFPWLCTDDIELGSFGRENEGYFDPWSLLTALKAKAISQGVEYIDGEVVTASVAKSDNGKVHVNSLGYQQANEIIEEVVPGLVVNACGPWAGKFVQMLSDSALSGLGSTRIAPLPVKARKRNIFLIHCSPGESNSYPVPPTNTPLTVDSSGAYFRSEGSSPGTFLCGISPTEDNDPDCNSVEELQNPDHSLFEEVIWPALYERVPAFERLKVKSFWSGFYEYNTLDQNCIIGEHLDFSNLLLCNGFSGHGLQQAPAAGRGVAELIHYGKYATLDLSKFSYDRIVNNTPFYEEGVV